MSDAAAFYMGEVHAHLLDALETLSGTEPIEVPGLDELRNRLETLHRLARKRRDDTPVDEEACLMLEQKLRMLDAWDGAVPRLPWQWTHGDYTWRNLLFDDSDRIVAIVDFDNLRHMPRARDVMRCFTLSFPHGSAQARSYFRGYASVAKPSGQEVTDYVQFYRYLSIYGVWPADARYLTTEAYQSRWDEFMTPRPREWETGWDRLADELAEIAARVS
jgi:Ser/Thr protein kinase RdoA (MazF antagonist)